MDEERSPLNSVGEFHDSGRSPINCSFFDKNELFRKIFSRKFIKTFCIGQFLSLLLCGTAVTSGLLQQQGVNVPTSQCFLNYLLLGIVFGGYLGCRQGDRSLMVIMKEQGWKFLLLALIDVEANYLVVMAYSLTSVTSVQVLDSFSIPTVMVLSCVFLRIKYHAFHICGAVVCLLGIGGLILADVLAKNHTDSAQPTNIILGDFLCICGAVLYSISNVGEEYVVKNFARSEFLGMIGIFGSFICGIQAVLVEREKFKNIDFSSVDVLLPWLIYTVCLFLLYTCMTVGIQHTSAAAVNLAILSADFYSLLVGLFVFKYTFHILYFFAMIFIVLGIIIYSVKDTGYRDAQNNAQAQQ